MVTRSRMLLLGILGAGIALLGYQKYQDHADSVRQQVNSARASEEFARAMARQSQSPAGQFYDLSSGSLPSNYPRPDSEWFANEREFYTRAVEGHRFDVVVVPLQVQGWGFDRATRSLMTAQLASAIDPEAPGRILDPYVADKILGEGRREYKLDDINRLADSLHAADVIWGAVGHDKHGRLRVIIMHAARGSKTPSNSTERAQLSSRAFTAMFTDARSPLQAFEDLLPDIAKFTAIAEKGTVGSPVDTSLDVSQLPESPMALTSASGNPARTAYTFLVFSALTPTLMERTRERFAEKAYLATMRLSSSAREFKVLRSRALMTLGYRTAALAVLGQPVNDEEFELSAVLNGNINEARERASKEQNPIKQLLNNLDVHQMAVAYHLVERSTSLDGLDTLGTHGDLWPYFEGRALLDWDKWSEFDNASLKAIADKDFPLPGARLQDLVRGEVAVGDPERLQKIIDLSVYNHTRQFLEKDNANWCCAFKPGAQPADYLQLIDAIGNDNVLRRVEVLADIKALPQAAVEYADSIQSVYKGYPYYALLRSDAERRSAATAAGSEKAGLNQMAYADALNALYWEQGQSTVSGEAFDAIAFETLNADLNFDNGYSADVPRRPYYPTWSKPGTPEAIRANGLAGLQNATWQFDLVPYIFATARDGLGDEMLMTTVTRAIQGRFIGSPQRNIFLANASLLKGDEQAASDLYREAIQFSPSFHEAYAGLGNLLFSSGKAKEASEVFLSYPGFQPLQKYDAVKVANLSREFGSLFFNSGDFDYATALYKIAAAQGAGSRAEMVAQMRLSVLAGNLGAALASAGQRARRYPDGAAYRDYLSILYATRHAEDASAGFDSLVKALPDPEIWQARMVGHHMGASTESDVLTWIKRGDLQKVGNHSGFAASYLARFATTDRIPSKDLHTAIDAIDHPVWQFEDGAMSVVRVAGDGREHQVLGPVGVVSVNTPTMLGMFNDPKRHQVRSQLSYFVDAYRDIKLGDYRDAKRLFDEASALYDMATSPSSFMLPYYALASANSGVDVSVIKDILNRTSPPEQRFDYQLATAVLQAVAGHEDAALASLKRARYRWPTAEERPLLIPYTYGDICALLFEVTKSAAIRSEALAWARSRERAQPWDSWSFALEAGLTSDPERREQAIAMTYYLDPKSSRLASFKKDVIEAAVKKYGAQNPFLRAKPIDRPGETTT